MPWWRLATSTRPTPASLMPQDKLNLSRSMILAFQHHLQAAISDVLRRTPGVTDPPAVTVDVPPDRSMGDLSVTVAFQLARALRKPPRAIAQEMAAALDQLPGISRLVAAPNGYLN